MQAALFEYLLRQGDNTLILGHRTSEWCGVAPVLEEDIALANTALDHIGQTRLWLDYAGEVEGKGRDADALAYHRDVWDFRNLLMLERPNGHFGHTILRQFLFDAFQVPNLTALENSSDQRVAEIAAKSVKEALYHLERSSETVIALGDGTDESNARMQEALEMLWPYTGEMFVADAIDKELSAAKLVPDLTQVEFQWSATVQAVLKEACLTPSDASFAHQGGKTGVRHTEHLGHLLATMQFLPRSYPDARW